MAQLPEGLYDQLVTESVRSALRNLEPHLESDVDLLKPVGVIEYLAREIALPTAQQSLFPASIW